MKTDWEAYYKNTNGIHKETCPFLKEAVRLCATKEAALDLGAGALSDTQFLVHAGFSEVVAIDAAETFEKRVKDLESSVVVSHNVAYDKYVFPIKHFDLVNAQYALPFNSPLTYRKLMVYIFNSLKPGGIFTGQMFGVHDDWRNDSEMTFVTREDVCEIIKDMQTIKIVESEYDGKDAAGNDKHWHIFNFLLKK